MTDHISFVQPDGWPRARGYSQGVVASGRVIRVSGQFGKVPDAAGVPEDSGFGAQWAQALRNVVSVVEAAGGSARDIVLLRAYLTNIDDFSTYGAEVGAGWGETLGKHFPAMTMVEVSRLLDRNAKLEIEAEAVIAG